MRWAGGPQGLISVTGSLVRANVEQGTWDERCTEQRRSCDMKHWMNYYESVFDRLEVRLRRH